VRKKPRGRVLIFPYPICHTQTTNYYIAKPRPTSNTTLSVVCLFSGFDRWSGLCIYIDFRWINKHNGEGFKKGKVLISMEGCLYDVKLEHPSKQLI
jgi:hypothetical protein